MMTKMQMYLNIAIAMGEWAPAHWMETAGKKEAVYTVAG